MPPQGRCEWNADQRAQLIQLVKQFDIIWLPVGATDKSKISISRRAAFEQIRQHFLDDGFTVDDLASQWRNLKDIFYKRFKEMNRRIQIGESNVKPPWRFFEALSFLAGNKAMDANRREVFGDSLPEGFAEGEGMEEDNLSSFGLLDELNEREESVLNLMKELKQEQDEIEEEQQQHHNPQINGGGCVSYHLRNGAERLDERPLDGERLSMRLTHHHPQNDHQPTIHQQQEFVNQLEGTMNRRRSSRVTPFRRVKRKISRGNDDGGTADAKRAYVQRTVPQRQLSPIWDALRQKSSNSPFGGSFPRRVRTSQHQQRNYSSNGLHSTNFLIGKNTTAISSEAAKMTNSVPPHGIEGRSKMALGETGTDRFRYFGAFVESAVRDLHHQCPDIARRLLHSIYGTVAEHQMEATLMFGGDEGPMDAQVLLDGLGADGKGAIDGSESLCWMP
ncbi:hypothetical protein GPALN_005447 [Globodera pallida]|nr:hypothetical protein GPALN_005447 [Globodera pallida]